MKKIKFDDTIIKLEEITNQIEKGELGLEEAIKLYEKGMSMILECRTILDEAEGKIRILEEQADGSFLTPEIRLNTEE